jgi:hypothetical protein
LPAAATLVDEQYDLAVRLRFKGDIANDSGVDVTSIDKASGQPSAYMLILYISTSMMFSTLRRNCVLRY